ncbi:MAG: hypothetical protein RMJ19_07880 [Gemmatales bacterium]|nr:hypothetical protein [Gemmatales bacterium]MDW8175575.1 hypothetical protein [Gemmatales bacterium]MDW8221475.1 hypothetical protein [Gemmatales bacterium]
MCRLWRLSLVGAMSVALILPLLGQEKDGGAIHRVLDGMTLPKDSRLGKPRDYNTTTRITVPPNREAWERRAQELREQVLVAMGLWPMPERTPINAVVHSPIDRDEYTVWKVYFESLPGHYVTGNLYRPKPKPNVRQRFAGVLCPHGHWRNGRFYEATDQEVKQQIASGAEKTEAGARYPLQARCAMLARMGCVVFHYDMVGYADSRAIGHAGGNFARGAEADTQLRLQSQMGLQTWNSIRALDFLLSLAPEVDTERIGVTGASGGGTQTFMLCAVDDRVKVAFPAVMVSMNMQGGCECENASLLRIGTNNVEIAALFAPKPLAMTGADDWTRDIEKVGLPELKRIYGYYHAEDLVAAKYFPFPHNYNQVSREMMYNWFNKHLNLGYPEPVAEKPFQPIPPKELSVFDEKHPQPKDMKNAEALRQYLSRSSDRQLDELAQDGSKYRQVVKTALRVMVQDRWPISEPSKQAPVAPVEGTVQKLEVEGYTLYKGLLARTAQPEVQLPALGLVPNDWRGRVCVWIHPHGKASLFDDRGKLIAEVHQLLKNGTLVLSADLFLTGEYHLAGKPTPPPPVHSAYAGYTFCYNPSVFACRVQDVLTLLAYARQLASEQAGEVWLLAFGKLGPCALLARCLADGAVARCAIDLAGFDFHQVQTVQDEMLLPGGLKYGGLLGFVPLCTQGTTVLFQPAPQSKLERIRLAQGVEIVHQKATAQDLVKALQRNR